MQKFTDRFYIIIYNFKIHGKWLIKKVKKIN
jgi:hypothetical protein